MVMMTNSITPNLDIESITLHPTKQGYRNKQQNHEIDRMG